MESLQLQKYHMGELWKKYAFKYFEISFEKERCEI